MKRIIAFALALVVVFGVSFALYKPERIEATARETTAWLGEARNRELCARLAEARGE